MSYWEGINLTPFEQSRGRTTIHMSHLITKYMSNSLSTMIIIQQQVHASTNICPRCGTVLETIQHIYQWTHEGIIVRRTASVYTFKKWLETRNTDPDISTIFVSALLYIAGEINDLPQCPNLALHYDILHIVCPYILLGFIPKSLALTQQTYFTHIGRKTGLKWASQLITQIWKLNYGQWLHRSKTNNTGETLDDNTR